MLTIDAFFKADVFLTQPLLTVVGSKAESKWVSDILMEKAASTDKKLVIIDGANHMQLYDKPEYFKQVVGSLSKFFTEKL